MPCPTGESRSWSGSRESTQSSRVSAFTRIAAESYPASPQPSRNSRSGCRPSSSYQTGHHSVVFAKLPRPTLPDRPELLIVDDDDELRELLAQTLEERGFSVVTAANGREALERLRSATLPAAVLLDLNMPTMNGW